MKLEFFTSPAVLKVGSFVAGPSALMEMRRFGKVGTPLYEITKIVNRRILWFRIHYAKLRRLSDGKMLKISLLDPPNDFFARSAPIDLQKDWAQIDQI